jgi:ABC-type sugar transport system ATPase subunit
MLRMIAGLEDINSGTISIDNQIVNDLPPKERNIAMVFQSYALYPHMTVFDNMAFGLKLEKRSKDEINERVQEAARILQIEDFLQRKPKQLSGGQRQRVAIGRAITRKPKVFLFDEPLSNLDAALRVQMRVELAKLHDQLNATMVYVTHDQTEALTFADQVVVMHEGQIVQTGTPIELFEKPKHTFVGHFIGSPGMNLLPCKITNGEINLAGQKIASNTSIKKTNFNKTQVGIRPEFINFSKDGIPAKVLKVNNIGRHKIVDVETGGGKIKILSNPQDEIPSGSAFVTFNQKYTYAYGDDWIIE